MRLEQSASFPPPVNQSTSRRMKGLAATKNCSGEEIKCSLDETLLREKKKLSFFFLNVFPSIPPPGTCLSGERGIFMNKGREVKGR